MIIGIPFIDDCHDAVIQLTSKIALCKNHEVAGLFHSAIAALEQTFDREQRLMEDFHFPALKCHMEQHARVLASLHHSHRDVMNGDYASGRRVAGELLPEWFLLHEATQDAALGIWVAYCKNTEREPNFDQCEATPCFKKPEF